MLALALLSACSNDEMNEGGNGEKASITITLKGENLSSKATATLRIPKPTNGRS